MIIEYTNVKQESLIRKENMKINKSVLFGIIMGTVLSIIFTIAMNSLTGIIMGIGDSIKKYSYV